MTPADLVLSKLEGVRPNGTGSSFVARCPAHKDRNPSLHVSTGDEGQALLRCFAGCSTIDIVKAIGLTMANLFPERERAEYRQPTPTPGPSRPCTVKALATAKGLPVAFLQARGFEDRPDGVLIPYKLEDGSPAPRQRLRTALVAKEGSRWLPGEGSPVPYGLDRLEEIQERGSLILVEGETDALTCWYHGYPALGIPGASMAKTIQAEHVHALETVFVWQEPDKGGEIFAASVPARLRGIGFKGAVRILKIDGTKDANDLHLKDPAAFDKAITAAMDAAREVATAEAVTLPLFAPIETFLLNPITPRWLVKGRLETPSTSLLFGSSGDGKSFAAVDLSATVVCGGDWGGGEIKTTGAVIYVADEGRAGIIRRFAAWQKDRGRTIPAGRLFISTAHIELDRTGAESLKAAVDELAKTSGPPVLIVADTLSRLLPAGGDENKTADMGPFMNECDGIRDRYGCVVLIVHHTGHAEKGRARGSTAIKAALDTEMRVSKKANGERLLEWTKMKDAEEPPPVSFRLKSVVLGLEEDGTVYSAAVVDWQGEANGTVCNHMTHQEELGVDTLRDAVHGAGGRPVSIEEWRPRFYSQHTGDNQAAKKKAFQRIRESLSIKRLIVVRGELYSLQATRPHEIDNRNRCDLD